MQPSITAFFKVKQPACSSPPGEQDRPEPTRGESANRDSSESEDEIQCLKRPIDSDDDENNITTARNKKRATLSSAETTPVKAQGAAKLEKVLKTIEVDSATDEDTTPNKGDTSQVVKGEKLDEAKKSDMALSPAPAARQLFSQSPLINVEALIKKKISSGSSALHENIGLSWFRALQPEFDKPYFKKLSDFVSQQRKAKTVYPPADQVFTWTHYHTIKDTRVVIIGQDPYHGPNQAHGLSFSVQKGVPVPMSLQNIFKELSSDIPGFKRPSHGNLTNWAKQGVLMLNACLTVNAGEANSHQGKGWETFTDSVISWISKNASNKVVFLLWGRFAQKKSSIIDSKRHKILTSVHPSPLSADKGFFGCKHFSQTNDFLESQKLPKIDWGNL